MSLLSRFREKQPSSAAKAKERLQIIVAHERNSRQAPNYLPSLQKDLLAVINKYVSVDMDQLQVNLSQEQDCSILELNLTLPPKD